MAKQVPQVQETFPTGQGDLKLTVANFDGQLGVSTVRLGDDVKAISSIVNVSLGLSTECKGQKVFVFTDIRDVLGETDDTSLTVSVSDDSSSKTFLYSEEAPGPGEAVSYTIIIDLT